MAPSLNYIPKNTLNYIVLYCSYCSLTFIINFYLLLLLSLWKFSWACLHFLLLNILGTAAQIHAWEQLNTAAVFNCWPLSGSGGAAELSVLLKGTWTKVVTSSGRPGSGCRLVTLIWWSILQNKYIEILKGMRVDKKCVCVFVDLCFLGGAVLFLFQKSISNYHL